LFCLEEYVKVNGVLCKEFNSLFVENEIKNAKIELFDGYTSAKVYKVYN